MIKLDVMYTLGVYVIAAEDQCYRRRGSIYSTEEDGKELEFMLSQQRDMYSIPEEEKDLGRCGLNGLTHVVDGLCTDCLSEFRV